MASVFDVAKYVIEKCGKMTSMKLEKLVYYCQAWSLAWDDVPLFDEEFEAWANGPVCPELFNMHRGLFVIDKDFFKDFTDYEFNEDQIETMNSVLKYYGNKEPHWLSSMTHAEDPWKNARRGVNPGEPSHNRIEKDAMMFYYGGLDVKEEK